jgi:hypothetical protein
VGLGVKAARNLMENWVKGYDGGEELSAANPYHLVRFLDCHGFRSSPVEVIGNGGSAL